MLRELAQIAMAIHLSAPNLPEADVNRYAAVIQQKAASLDLDPFEAVAISTHESQFRERVISNDHRDYGLMQVRRTPALMHTDLLNGAINIGVGMYLMKLNKEMCAKVLKREPTFAEWHPCFAGYCRSPEAMCKPTAMSVQHEKYRTCLENNVLNGGMENCRQIFWSSIR
jgi:Transglycosylase SLT domain